MRRNRQAAKETQEMMKIRSVEDFKRAYLPNSYSEEKDRRRGEQNIGAKLAEQVIDGLRERLQALN